MASLIGALNGVKVSVTPRLIQECIIYITFKNSLKMLKLIFILYILYQNDLLFLLHLIVSKRKVSYKIAQSYI